MIDDVLKPEERAVFALRSLFSSHGFLPFKMSRFEEYELYARNKDFLVSDSVITFTDTDGKLMALKPDVTLSIIKNARFAPGEKQKLFYNENVYRVSAKTHQFTEIMQSGVECIGNLNDSDKAGMLELALSALGLLGGSFVLSVSHMGLISAAIEEASSLDGFKAVALDCLSGKNLHELAGLCNEFGVEEEKSRLLFTLAGLHGEPEDVLGKLESLPLSAEAKAAAKELAELASMLKGAKGFEKLRFDFSIASDMKYYNGIVFSGFLEGVPEPVLSGGQYDRLLRRMGKKGSALGFAVYLDTLELQSTAEEGKDDGAMLNVALPKGRLGEKIYDMFEKAGYGCPEIRENSRKLIFENSEAGVRYFWVKPSDVAIYVERGAADVGVAGKDILLEYSPDVFELADLKKGKCRMCVAAPKDFVDDGEKTLRAATKFVNIAKKYYSSTGRDIDIIKLNGSIEIAPILGLSDVIVDIVETGTTLKENDLEVKTEILPISARLIANKTSFKFKTEAIETLCDRLEESLEWRVES